MNEAWLNLGAGRPMTLRLYTAKKIFNRRQCCKGSIRTFLVGGVGICDVEDELSEVIYESAVRCL